MYEYRNRTRYLLKNKTEAPIPGFYGSSRPGQFLRDAMRGQDSLDVIVIGDSNAGFAPAGAGVHGYTGGWNKVMQFGLHVPQYATPICSGGTTSPTSLTSGNNNSGREMMWGLGIGQQWNAHTEAGGSNTGTTFKQMIQTAAASPAGEIAGLMSWLGFNSTDYNVNSTANKMLFPLGWMNNPAVVEAGARFTSSFNNSVTISNQAVAGWNAFGSEMGFGSAGTGGHALQYRIVYGTFPTAGSFKPYAFYLATTGAVLRDSSTTSTGGGYGYATKTFDVSTFTLASSGNPTRIAFTWDGANSATAADQANGPFACLWQSVIRPHFKGYAVSCLNYFGGVTTNELAQKLEDADKMLDCYLKEIRQRQIGTTPGTAGTGRVLVFCNTGTNGPDTSTTWVNGVERIRNRISERWIQTGGNLSQLSFVFTVTHATSSGAIAWTASRAAVSAAANAWGKNNANNGYGVAVVDINDSYPSLLLSKYSMYDATTEAHLRVVTVPPATTANAIDSYEAIVQRIVSTLMS